MRRNRCRRVVIGLCLCFAAGAMLASAPAAEPATAKSAAASAPGTSAPGVGAPGVGAPGASAPAVSAGDAPTHAEVRHHGSLGVLVSKSADGVQVVGLIPGGAAARGGMRVGDEIRYVGDERIHGVEQLGDEIRKYPADARVDLTIRRNGEREIVKARLSAAPDAASERNAAGSTALSGDATSLADQVRLLQRQIGRMQRQIDQLRSNQRGRISRQQDMRNPDWGWNGHGEMDDDPSLFQ